MLADDPDGPDRVRKDRRHLTLRVRPKPVHAADGGAAGRSADCDRLLVVSWLATCGVGGGGAGIGAGASGTRAPGSEVEEAEEAEVIGGLIVAGAIFLSASVFMRYETDSWALAVSSGMALPSSA
jgi:hypothetical protein